MTLFGKSPDLIGSQNFEHSLFICVEQPKILYMVEVEYQKLIETDLDVVSSLVFLNKRSDLNVCVGRCDGEGF